MNSLSFNPGQGRSLERRIRRVDVATGTLIATAADEEPVVLGPGEGEDFDDALLTLHSPTGAKAAITYFDDPEPKTKRAVRGDSGGSGGSYESRTLKELQALAKDRGLTGYSELNKTDLIEVLRG